MIKIDLSRLDLEARYYVEQIIKKDGSLYASKPKKADKIAQYIWRELVWYFSEKPCHQSAIRIKWYINAFEGKSGKELRRLGEIVHQVRETTPIKYHVRDLEGYILK